MPRFRPTLRQTIGLLLGGLILLCAVFISVHSYLTSRRSLLLVSRGMIEQDALLVREQVRLFLDGLRADTEQTLRLLDSGQLRPQERGALEGYFFQVLAAHASITKIGYGDEDGGFLMVARQPDGSLATKVVRREGERILVRWRQRPPGGSLGEVLGESDDADDPYDPRVRPWYAEARRGRRLYFTDAYVFHSDKQPGITVAAAHRGPGGALRGVLMVDVGLRELSRFVSNIQIGESGHAFLFDRAGALLAAPGGAVHHQQGVQGPRLRLVAESPRPEMASLGALPSFRAFLHGGLQGERTLRYRHGGRDQVAHLAPIQVDDGLRWGVGVIFAENELLADVQRASMRNLATALLFTLVAAAAGALVARFIVRSLETLVEETARLRQLEFAASQAPLVLFQEVSEVLQAFEHMKVGLRAFQKYVPVHLVRSLLAARNDPNLGGEVRELTLFFSDIRGFTSISEELPPQELAEKLARYLSVVTMHIHAHGGTVDKYMGDAVMAFWGAPQAVEDHALLACQAALRCQTDIRALWEREPGFPRFATRIGLHTAEVLVGNFGSMDRLNYTVLGDGVNLASRLERLNDILGTEILISEETVQRLRGRMETRRIGLFVVRGRQHPLWVHELLGERGLVAAEHLMRARRYEEALGLYLERRFAEAEAAFAALLDEQEDPAARLLWERCRSHQETPPPPEWTGAFTILSK